MRPLIETALADLKDVDVVVYEPTATYQNVAKKKGIEKLTPARALIAEMVRRYWVLGIECTLLETHKLAWFVERTIKRMGLNNPLDLRFEARRYGPYADRLTHLLDGLDGSYLHCDKRLADAGAFDTIWFDDSKREKIAVYLNSKEARNYVPAIESTDALIDGFQSPLGLEALATVDWLIVREGAEPTLEGIKAGIRNWPAGEAAAQRKEAAFCGPPARTRPGSITVLKMTSFERRRDTRLEHHPPCPRVGVWGKTAISPSSVRHGLNDQLGLGVTTNERFGNTYVSIDFCDGSSAD